MTEESGPSYRGSILISNSTIISDDFNKTVVFMIEHDSSGAFGLVINKKSEYSLHEVVVGVPENVAEEVPMYWGGPVDHSFISILHNQSSFKDPGLEVIPGVYLSRSYELLISLLENSESRFKVFHGYSGWGKMQLESEFERKSWVEHKVNDKFILYRDTEEAWREALKSKGGIYKYFAEHTNDPLLN
ncbi:MAG: YqgE/AlgH family protein [Leptospiraceae bacterium]|nr:YqgE/AlgH family protein [Leptospiraceae bacterium]